MLFGRYGTFTGGINLPDEKQATLTAAIRPVGPLQRLLVPLAQESTIPARPVVQPGQDVRAGEIIARADGPDSADVPAPLSGRVVGPGAASVAGRYHFVRVPAIEMTDLSAPDELAVEDLNDSILRRPADALAGALDDACLWVHRRGSVPLARWLDRARAHCRLLVILNAMEDQPRVTSDHRLLVEYGPQVVGGLTILSRLAGAGETMLAVDRRWTGEYGPLEAPARVAGVELIALTHKYPIGADGILTRVLARRRAALGSDPMAAGCAIIDAATCLAVYRAVVCGQNVTGRVVTVAGERVEKPGNYYVPYGALCAEIAPGPLIHGGPMVGLRCADDAVVTPATGALLAMTLGPRPNSGPCIRCGWCTDHCPAAINVAAVNDHYELVRLDRARRARVARCVECGICSYVCPARLPLSQRVRELKHAARSPRPDAEKGGNDE